MGILAVKSAARAIEVLECFGAAREPKSLKSICEMLRYPQSSTSVLLKTLTVMGYLNYDRRRRVYFPTLKVTALGDWVPQALFGNGRALEAMRDVHSATGETVSIAVKNDIYFQYIKVIQSMHALRFHVSEGTMRPLTQSAVGWLLMSTLKGDDLDNVIRRANIAAGKAEAVKVPAMVATVAQARRQGYASAENVPFLGGATLCVLLPMTIQGQPVALGLGGSLERIRANRTRYLAALKRCARELRGIGGGELGFDIEF
ncbi:IclR family transcriptional regulator [Methylocapsa sp. S129]|uniref:IclR family transcriptional regulator n=1 Tax=Methylocapsa sp. S129 TaxID=1641869 RepID=UPI00131E456D|nr:helix-turn-helix domain-containing protein [Methylocapsa sp. S129]